MCVCVCFCGASRKLLYHINNAHRYVVEMTAYDRGTPQRSSKALVIVPLLNYNVNAPQYTAPVIISAATTHLKGELLGILNAWDIDGDKVQYSLNTSKIHSNIAAIIFTYWKNT